MSELVSSLGQSCIRDSQTLEFAPFFCLKTRLTTDSDKHSSNRSALRTAAVGLTSLSVLITAYLQNRVEQKGTDVAVVLITQF